MKYDEEKEIRKNIIIEVEKISKYLEIEDLIVVKFEKEIEEINDIVLKINFTLYEIIFNLKKIMKISETELYFNICYSVMHLYHYYEIEFLDEDTKIKYNHLNKIKKWKKEYLEMFMIKNISYDYDSSIDSIAFSLFYLENIKNININEFSEYNENKKIKERINYYKIHNL